MACSVKLNLMLLIFNHMHANGNLFRLRLFCGRVNTPRRYVEYRSEVFTVWTNYPSEAHTECLIQECADAGLKELSLFGKEKTCCNLPDLCLIKLKPNCVALLRRGKVTRIFSTAVFTKKT